VEGHFLPASLNKRYSDLKKHQVISYNFFKDCTVACIVKAAFANKLSYGHVGTEINWSSWPDKQSWLSSQNI